jgi:acetone carboxylase gamma subunit
MTTLKQKGRAYNIQWLRFDQSQDLSKPTVLVVADELFMMSDERLKQKARYACPNSFAESKQGGRPNQKIADRQKEEQYLNQNCVQAHFFNNL